MSTIQRTLDHLDHALAETEHALVCKARKAAEARHLAIRERAAHAATMAHVVGTDWDGCPILSDDAPDLCENR